MTASLSVIPSSEKWIVCKFGGTSVSSLAAWQNILRIVRERLQSNLKIVIVCSAPTQVSNTLDELIDSALQGNYQQPLKKINEIYHNLSLELSLDFDFFLQEDFNRLQQFAEGIALLKEASPRIKAQIMAFGELSLTRLGAAFLASQSINLKWQDARNLLIASSAAHPNFATSYLAATCESDFDAALKNKLDTLKVPVILTQGFIASNANEETVLLGRGGSDVSAAFFAAKMAASCCEIWTDVPGVYTANPHQIPQARLLKYLDYDEAQEIASMGGKVLHPNCISPLKQQQIPLFVKYTLQPEGEGTKIGLSQETEHLQIKSIINKYKVLLISIDTMKMWHQVGFLADIFNCFKKHDVSIDLVSTSESNVTVSLDLKADALIPQTIQDLLNDLNIFSRAKTIGPCASISLIGQNIRGILSKLGSIFSVFEQQKVHLLSQAANDLNLTFVVDEDQAQRLTQRLHDLLIEEQLVSHYFGKSWQQQFLDKNEKPQTLWWQKERDALLELIEDKKQPFYVYCEEVLRETAASLKNCDSIDRIFFSMKANNNPEILGCFYQSGIGFECVSFAEVTYLLNLFPQIEKERILFTPNFSPKEEYQQALDLNIYLTVDSLYPLQAWPELFMSREILIRIDPGQGYGHHKYVCTGGADSKFGIPLSELDILIELAEKLKLKIIGLHAHSGSGILRAQTWQENSIILTDLLTKFPDVEIINLGGGLGVVEKPSQKPLDLKLLDKSLEQIKKAFPNIQLWLEPGRYLVASAGIILARVTQVKSKNNLLFIGIETGMNSLIRPALYGAYHEIVNLTRLHEANFQCAHIVGPICESGDTLGYSRLLPQTKEGDVLLIANAGAYGYVMSSYYNMREPAQEIFWA